MPHLDSSLAFRPQIFLTDFHHVATLPFLPLETLEPGLEPCYPTINLNDEFVRNPLGLGPSLTEVIRWNLGLVGFGRFSFGAVQMQKGNDKSDEFYSYYYSAQASLDHWADESLIDKGSDSLDALPHTTTNQTACGRSVS